MARFFDLNFSKDWAQLTSCLEQGGCFQHTFLVASSSLHSPHTANMIYLISWNWVDTPKTKAQDTGGFYYESGFLEGSPAKEEACILSSLLFSQTWTLALSVYLFRQPISLHTNLYVYSKHCKLIVVITHSRNPNLPGSATNLGSFCPLFPAARLMQEGRCRQSVSCAYGLSLMSWSLLHTATFIRWKKYL